MEFFVLFNSLLTANKMKQLLHKNHNMHTLYIYSTSSSLNIANYKKVFLTSNFYIYIYIYILNLNICPKINDSPLIN